MNCWKQLVFFLWVCILDLCQSQEQFAGPFRIVVQQIGQCDDTGTHQIYMSSTRINKVSRTKYFYSTNVTTDVIIDDNLTVELDLANFGNGGYNPHFMTLEFPTFCTSMKEMIPVFFKAIMDSVHSDCPIQPGTYEVNNLDMDDLKVAPVVPNFPYGKYRADYTGKINGTLVGCIRYYVDVVPAKRMRARNKNKNNN
ncbi:uncharacterized protein [Halyomorpha halys]|uniref:uncharacterized protein n=1 Tax=Halyomorpha halys TaxID=286706 RepID=UPI0006D50745|nr:uncharacterized protein LOC106687433 [Halyomorpha halys]